MIVSDNSNCSSSIITFIILLVIAYFISKIISKKISQASKVREDSDYDDEFIPTDEETKNQIDTAKELISLVEGYLKEYNKKVL